MEKELEQLVKQSSDPSNGVTNRAIHNFAKLLCPSFYKGLYHISIEKLPHHLIYENFFSLIVNVFGHFIAIIGRPSHVLYIDSFGRMCDNQKIKSFLLACNRPIYTNTRVLQDLNSVYCGIYALLFCKYFDIPNVSPRKQLTFVDKDLVKNDKLCMSHLNYLLS